MKPWMIAVPVCGLLAAALFSQSPAFEVASVKPSGSTSGGRGGKGGPGYTDPGLFSVRNRPLKNLILMAFEVKDYQLSGGPAWMESDRFDVDARPPADATRPQMMAMLRSLLADRFQLRYHRETRPVPAYVLTVAKGGPKFGPQFRKLKDGEMLTDGRSADRNKGMPMGGTIAQFVFLLQSNMRIFDPLEGRNVSAPDTPPVLDQTGLEGDFDILLKTDTHEDWPAIVEHQLGLKLELRKVPVEMLVIESASKPAEN